MLSAVIRRGGPVQVIKSKLLKPNRLNPHFIPQNAVSGGGMTYTQSICSKLACSPTGMYLLFSQSFPPDLWIEVR